MRNRNFLFTSLLSFLIATPAFANWEYSGYYVGDGLYTDDGTRFIMSARGGAALGTGKIKNNIGAVVMEYYYIPGSNQVIPSGQCEVTGGCDGLDVAGFGNLSQLPATKNFESFSFAAGASIGWTMPNQPQWRMEFGWDHIDETEYNSSPMFSGNLTLDNQGTLSDAFVESGSVNSKVTTDVVSLMFFHDFFDGIEKPIGQFIPYLGFGAGYGDTKTILNFFDPYGDISTQLEFSQYGEADDSYGLTQFYLSEYNTTNVVGILAGGVSYGITRGIFLDLGARLMLLPNIKWKLSNEDGTKHRNLFESKNNVYMNFSVGVRFEF